MDRPDAQRIRELIAEHCTPLTDEELDWADGRLDRLVELLRKRAVEADDEVREQIEAFVAGLEDEGSHHHVAGPGEAMTNVRGLALGHPPTEDELEREGHSD